MNQNLSKYTDEEKAAIGKVLSFEKAEGTDIIEKCNCQVQNCFKVVLCQFFCRFGYF
jgi:hypothetical protein